MTTQPLRPTNRPVVEVLPDPARRWLPATTAQKDALDSRADILFLGGAVGSLKDLAVTTPIPTPTGWTTMLDLQVGDTVFDDNGTPCTVTGTSPIYLGNRVYEIEFDDGTVIRAGADHLWLTMNESERMRELRHTEHWRAKRRATRPRRGRGLKPWTVERNEANRKYGDDLVTGTVRTTEQIAGTVQGHGAQGRALNHSIKTASPLQLPQRSDLPIHPYVLGVWLGDGTSSCGALTIGEKDQCDLIFQLRMCGRSVVDRKDPISFGVPDLHKELRLSGLLNNKHIPREYLRASREQRIALLQGLMDTDGTANPTKGCVFYNTNLPLMISVRELLLTLGVKANISSWTARVNGKECGLAYGISFVAPFPVFRLGRKLRNQVTPRRATCFRRYIKHVTEVPTEPTKCITVSSSSKLYLCSESFIPTHNTSTMLVDLIQERSYPTMRSYFFRKTFPAMEDAIDQAHQLFSHTGGKYTAGGENAHTWMWPSGAQFRFRQLASQKDVDNSYGKSMSAMGFDEATHWEEKVVRQMIVRNRSTDPNVKIRVRLGSNPGNVGHKWIQKLFMGGFCPHCEPQKAPPQKVLRWDGEWPSDNSKLEIIMENGVKERLSIAYILSNVRDHSLYPPSYLARVKMQSPKTAKALLDGCWKIFEGQYFDVWEPQRGLTPTMTWAEALALPPGTGPMAVPRHALNEQWWWPRWVSSDYGFSISIGAAHLFIHEPQSQNWPRGRVYCVDEFGCQETSPDLAQILIDRWVLGDDKQPLEYRWMPWYLSPDSFADRGVAFTIAGQMNTVLGRYGRGFTSADNDRQGGAIKIYSGLQNGELVICENCVKTIEAMESRIHDPDKENDVLKVSGDEIDDYYDSFRYGWKSFETARQVTTPTKVRIEERLKNEFSKDPTTAMFHAQQIKNEEENRDRPTSYVTPTLRRRQIAQWEKNRR